MDNLSFFTFGHSTSIVEKLLKKAGKIALKWGDKNSVTYYISKTEVVLFFKAHNQKLAKQISKTQTRFGRETISFNKEVTRY